MPHNSKISGFSLVELLATIAVMAAVIAIAMFFVANYVTWAQNTSDKHTYEVLNGALDRYKTEGGGVIGLTHGAATGRVIAQLQVAVTWANTSHCFISPNVTYPGRSIGTTGDGARYHITRYNTYSDGSGQSNSTNGQSFPLITVVSSGSASAAYSADGINFTTSPTGLPSSASWLIAFGAGKYAAVAGGSATSAYSSDGVNWQTSTMPSASQWHNIAFGAGKFVVLPYNSASAAYSSDGMNWQTCTLPYAGQWYQLTYANGKFLALEAGQNGAAYSSDGIHWTGYTRTWGTPGLLTCGNGLWVDVAGTVSYYSTDGINWSSANLPAGSYNWQSIGFANGLFIVAGGRTWGYSSDGVNWTITGWVGGNAADIPVFYANGKYISVQGNDVFYTSDLVNFTQVAIPSGYWASASLSN